VETGNWEPIPPLSEQKAAARERDVGAIKGIEPLKTKDLRGDVQERKTSHSSGNRRLIPAVIHCRNCRVAHFKWDVKLFLWVFSGNIVRLFQLWLFGPGWAGEDTSRDVTEPGHGMAEFRRK
jgi:hypothetical protein